MCELPSSSNHQSVPFTRVAITDDHPVLAASLATALRARQDDVQVRNSPDQLTEELVLTIGVVSDETCNVHWQALEQAREFYRAGGKSLILLQDTGGRFDGGPSQGWSGGIAALARTAALEWPEMKMRCIDIAVNPADMSGTAQRLIDALQYDIPMVGVDLSGRFYTLQEGMPLVHPAHSMVTTPVTESDVWLVSGGARGVTAACIEALARCAPARFALLGRSVPMSWPDGIAITDDIKELRRALAAQAAAAGERLVPKEIERKARQALAGQEIRQTLSALEATGSVVRYYACDISKLKEVSDVLVQINDELGQVSALVHGAGVLADSLLVDKAQAQFDRVFDTKVGGLHNLLTALGDTTLSHIALFSSAAAFYGNTGQSDYAMANEVLNRVAQSLKQGTPQATVKSFNWGPWDSGMVDQTLARYFEERGIGLISLQAGAALFVQEMLAGDHHGVELLVGDPWANPLADSHAGSPDDTNATAATAAISLTSAASAAAAVTIAAKDNAG